MTANSSKTNPYMGPRAFQEGEFIFGRDYEIHQLMNLLIAERIVLLHSPSGAGKSSLIQAGLLPVLREEGFRVLPIVRVNQLLPGLRRQPGFNRYIFSTLLSLEERLPAHMRRSADELATKTFADYMAAVKEEALARDPSFGGKDASSHVEDASAGGDDGEPDQRGNLALIFDQFEEILTVDPTDLAEKIFFFNQLGKVLQDRAWWALFAMREDHLAAMSPFVRPIPTRMDNTYRLDFLDAPSAQQAIQEPARRAKVEFSDAAAQKLLDDLRRVQVQQLDGTWNAELGPTVEPLQLQVVCFRMWEKLAARGAFAIDVEAIEQIGDVNLSLAEYYQQKIGEIAASTGVRERTIREWFDRRLITETGNRGQALMGQNTSEGLDNRAIELLENAHLIRAEKRGGATWFELAHDRLIQPVRDNNTAWFQKNLSLLQRQADLWNQQGRRTGLLIDDPTLVEVEQWARGHREELTAVEREFLKTCREARERKRIDIEHKEQSIRLEEARKRAEQQAEAARRLRVRNRVITGLGIVAALFAVLAAVLAINAFQQRKEAQYQSRNARSLQLAADLRSQYQQYPQLGLLLGVEAVRANLDYNEPRLPGAEQSLRDALQNFNQAGPVLRGHSGPIDGAVFSPDGNWLVTSAKDPTPRLWNLRSATFTNPTLLAGHTQLVTTIAISPDSRWLVSASDDKTVRVWDLKSAQPAQNAAVLTGFEDTPWTVAISPDSRWLAVGAADRAVRVWSLDPANPTPAPLIYRGKDTFISAAFSADGRWLAAGSWDKTVYVWDFQAGAFPDAALALVGHSAFLNQIRFSPDGRWLATASNDATTRLWDLSKTDLANQAPVVLPSLGPVWTVGFSPDSRWVATGSADSVVRLWNLGEADPAKNFLALRGHTKGIGVLSFGPPDAQGRAHWLASGSWDNTARIWDLTSPDPSQSSIPLRAHESSITMVNFSPDGRWLATGSSDFAVRLWDMQRKDFRFEPAFLREHAGPVWTVGFSPDGRWLATGAEDGMALLWETRSANQARKPVGLHGHKDAVNAVLFTPDSRRLVTASSDATIRVWNVTAPDPGLNPIILEGHTRPVTAMAITRDGRWLATASTDGTARLWDLSADDPRGNVRIMDAEKDNLYAVAISPDGRWVAAGGNSGMVHLWNTDPGNRPAKAFLLKGPREAVWTVAFRPDSRELASGSDDGSVRLWDLTGADPSQNPVVWQEPPPGANQQVDLKVKVVTYDPSGDWLAIAGTSGRVWLRHIRKNGEMRMLTGHEDHVLSASFSPDGRYLATGSGDLTIRLWDMDPP